MLRARHKVLIYHPPLLTQISGKTEITVNLSIGALYLLFLGSGIVENESVKIKRDVAGRNSRQWDFGSLQKLDGSPGNRSQNLLGKFIHPLSHGAFRRNDFIVERF